MGRHIVASDQLTRWDVGKNGTAYNVCVRYQSWYMDLWLLKALMVFNWSFLYVFCHCFLLLHILPDPLTESSFSSNFFKHLHYKTVWARDLKCLENIHLPPCVTGHMSHVLRHNICIFCFVLFSGGASWWRVCYQWGLPRLVWQKCNKVI